MFLMKSLITYYTLYSVFYGFISPFKCFLNAWFTSWHQQVKSAQTRTLAVQMIWICISMPVRNTFYSTGAWP